jgi:hypothetical protein
MCSGCSGEYEGREAFGRRSARPEGGANQSPDTARESPAAVPSADEFEVLVGADSITEIRRIGCNPCSAVAKSREKRIFDGKRDKNSWQTHALSAKDYRTSAPQRYVRLMQGVSAGKWLLLMGLALLSLAGLTLWFFLV